MNEFENKLITKKLEALKKSTFRAKFKLSQKDRAYALEKGLDTLKKHAFELLEKRLAPKEIKNDGKQTPMRGHPVFVAQHATATCCRDCLQKWHHIEKGKKLSQNELEFVVSLVMAWLTQELNQ